MPNAVVVIIILTFPPQLEKDAFTSSFFAGAGTVTDHRFVYISTNLNVESQEGRGVLLGHSELSLYKPFS